LDYYNFYKLHCLVFPDSDFPQIQIQRWRKNR
jgi:hypothetical protein